MANIDSMEPVKRSRQFLAAVYNWKDFYTPKIKKVVTVNNEILKSYTGNYKLYRNTFNVTLEKEGLMLGSTVKRNTNFILLLILISLCWKWLDQK